MVSNNPEFFLSFLKLVSQVYIYNMNISKINILNQNKKLNSDHFIQHTMILVSLKVVVHLRNILSTIVHNTLSCVNTSHNILMTSIDVWRHSSQYFLNQTEFDFKTIVEKILLFCFNVMILSIIKVKLKMQERKYFLLVISGKYYNVTALFYIKLL